jgi:heat shock protein HslJ
MPRSRAPRALLLGAALWAGCAPATKTVAAVPDAPPLAGTAWVLASLPGQSLPAGRPATLRFEDGRAQGFDGCNQFGTPYTSEGATLSVSGPGASTMMACPPDREAAAEAFRAALTGAKGYRVDGGRLLLVGADGATLATFEPQSTDLAGTAWEATAINNGKQAVASVVKDSSVTLELGVDGKTTGSAGCNRFTGTYRAEGSRVTFGPAATTRKMCPRPEVMEQEQAFLTALGTVATARVDGDRLELRTAAGALAVQLERTTKP